MAGIRAPTQTLLITERSSRGYQTAFTAGQFNTVRLRWDNAESRFVMAMVRHDGRCTAAAADGHAETMDMPPVGAVPEGFRDMGDVREERRYGLWRPGTGVKLFLRQTGSGRDDKNTGGF
jgi:prepilin-type processing-associated H-X9-DG protein